MVDTKANKQRVLNRAYKYASGLIAYFIVSAILGSIVGSALDSRFQIKPWGMIGTLLVTYVISWIIVKLVVLKRFNNNQEK